MFEDGFVVTGGLGFAILGLIFTLAMLYFFWYLGRQLINTYERTTGQRFVFKWEKYDWNFHDKKVIDKKMIAEATK